MPPSYSPKSGFQFIGFPSEWGVTFATRVAQRKFEFPIYWVPQRVGRYPY